MQADRTTKALVGIIVFLSLGSLQACMALQEGSGDCSLDSPEACRVQAEAEAGDASAQNNLGLMYADGEGVPKDDAEAVRWYRMAAEQGLSAAQFFLGHMYRTGEGVPEDDAETVRWYRMAAEQGYARAQSNLGVMYATGEGVPQNDAEAVRWFRMAAEQGYARAQNSLGLMYATGEGVVQDDARAYLWLNLAAAASQGDARARSVEGRDLVAARLSPTDRAAAQRLATQCQTSDFKDCGEPE